MIKLLECTTCDAPLPLVDEPTVACPYCGATCAVPEEHRRALRIARERTEATARAIARWQRLDAIHVPRALYVAASLVPFSIFTVGIACALVAVAVGYGEPASIPRTMALAVWLPLIPTMYVAGEIGLRNLLRSGVDWMSATLASLPPATEGGPARCRRCGAPLAVEPNDVFVRCAYCDTESLVGVSPERVSAFDAARSQAEGSAVRAAELLVRQRRAARFQIVGRTLAIAGLVVPVLVWSFARSWQASPWSLLVALDVWVLGICLWWFAREAFLPPVRIDEVFEMAETFSGRDVARATAPEPTVPSSSQPVCAWYDSSNDSSNFTVPGVVALLFLALEALLIWT